MCGLIGLFSKKGKPVGQQVFELYKKQEARGKKGFGYLAISKDGLLTGVHRSLDEAGIRELLMKEKAPNILFHHRYPSSTVNTIGTTHPIFVSNKELEFDYYFSHNGVITNDVMLKTEHNKLGYVYTTEFTEHTVARYLNGREEDIDSDKTVFNDSEALAIELARYVDGITDSIDTFGAVAFWGVALVKGTNKVAEVYYGKNLGRELKSLNHKKYKGFSSVTGVEMDTMKLFQFNFKDTTLYESDLPIQKSQPRVPKVTHSYNPYAGYNVEPVETFAEKGLENKHYTFEEAVDSGVPLSDFMANTLQGVKVYIPSKFAGSLADRKPFVKETQLKLQQPMGFREKGMTEKTEDLLEELCTKLAGIESLLEENDDQYKAHTIDSVTYRDEEIALENKVMELEEKISLLNVTEAKTEDMLNLCREMEAYNKSYHLDGYEIT